MTGHRLVLALGPPPHLLVQATAHFPPAACPNNVCVTDDVTRTIFGQAIAVNDVWSTVLAAVIVAASGLYVARKVTSGTPGRAQLLWESLVGWIGDQLEGRLGPAGRPAVPLAVCLFAFILIANWLEIFWPAGHAPNYLPTPTSNVNIDYAMALTVWVYTNGVAIRRAGLGRYFKHFTEPYAFMTPFKVVEELAKVLSLSLRLFGNVFAGALVLALIAGLFPLFIIPFADFIWVPFDLFIFAIQAFIFSLLTIIYYQEAVGVAEGGVH
ncbi:MAG: F0F1 ATP synthase subunit A [Acidimicrobiales bacterium]